MSYQFCVYVGSFGIFSRDGFFICKSLSWSNFSFGFGCGKILAQILIVSYLNMKLHDITDKKKSKNSWRWFFMSDMIVSSLRFAYSLNTTK